MIKDYTKMITMNFKNEGNIILVIGKTEGHIDQSLFARTILDEKNGPPPEINLFNEKNNGETILKLIESEYIKSAHDVSLGGILMGISKMCINGDIGIEIKKPNSLLSKFEYFFSEDQGRYIIEIAKSDLKKVTSFLEKNAVHYDEIGTLKGKSINFDEKTIVPIDELRTYNSNWLKDYME